MNPRERTERHSRQLRLAGIGREGQARLAAARVLVVGCGGLGAPVVAQLAAAGCGTLTLVDDDRVERSNLNRQWLHRDVDIGREKALRAAEWVRELDPALNVVAQTERLSWQDARERVRGHDLVMDCADGLPTKFLLSDACVLEDVPLVHGAASAFAGQVLWIPGRSGPCLRCLFEDVPAPGTVPTCQQIGVLAATCGMVGSMMVLEAIQFLSGMRHAPGRFFSVDTEAPMVREIRLTRRVDCIACGDTPDVDARTPDDYTPRAR